NTVLEIDNQYLGYKITYTLSQFRYDGASVSYAGYAGFLPYFTTDSLLNARWVVNRRNAYWYADTHFFKALKDHTTATQHYEAYSDKPGQDPSKRSQYFHQDQVKKLVVNNLDSLTSTEKPNAVYRLRVPTRLEIHHRNLDGESSLYKDKPVEVSWIETNGRPIRFNNEGIVLNPQDCVFSGYLVNRRVANMLPLDYRADQPFRPLEKANRSARNNWMETPFFTTDRPYYFRQDIVRLSGLMHYDNPERADSLSSVVQVELVHPTTKKILVRQRVAILDGRFETQLALPDSGQTPTHYLLRVYTNWMRNFGDSCYAYRWLPIMLPNQLLETTASADSSFAGHLDLTQTDSVLIVRPTTAFMDRFEWASLVMADAAFEPNTTPLSGFFPAIKPLEPTQKPPFAIDRGIMVSGRLTKPRLKESGFVTLLSPTQQLTFFADVSKQGVFRFSDLPLEDRQTVLLKFADAKGNTISHADVTLDSLDSPGWIPTLPKPLRASQLRTDTTTTNWARDGILINEVTVKAPKPPRPPASIYGAADYTVQGKDLYDKAVGTNFLVALQGRVPGINIVEFPDENGFSKLVITMRGGSTVGGFQKGTLPQPLVLVDGIPFDNINQLQNLPASQVERVEVVNRAVNLLGLRGYAGVISVITKHASGLAPTATPDPDFIRKTISGIESAATPRPLEPIHFWLPSVGEEEVRIPMPKSTGTYKLILEGLTKSGEVVRLSEVVKR
ncbi:MAG: Plug domain-containing protein, partial [Rudanella sp.]|nr:Plug domain-containing protein [Rudanella sp.]